MSNYTIFQILVNQGATFNGQRIIHQRDPINNFNLDFFENSPL